MFIVPFVGCCHSFWRWGENCPTEVSPLHTRHEVASPSSSRTSCWGSDCLCFSNFGLFNAFPSPNILLFSAQQWTSCWDFQYPLEGTTAWCSPLKEIKSKEVIYLNKFVPKSKYSLWWYKDVLTYLEKCRHVLAKSTPVLRISVHYSVMLTLGMCLTPGTVQLISTASCVPMGRNPGMQAMRMLLSA